MGSKEFGEHVYRGNNSFDCVVVGAGIEGSSTAYNLVKSGCKTLLLEQFALPHSRGSSHGQSRITRYAYPEKHYVKMMEEAFPMWAELEKETKTTLFRNTGLLIMQRPPYNVYNERLQNVIATGKPYKELTTQELRQRYPGMSLQPDYKVFLDLSAGTLRADKGLKCFQDEFKRRGGIIRDEEKVLHIIPGTEVTIQTTKGQYFAKSIVLTPGPWASKMLKPLGLNPPLQPLRMQVLYWKTKSNFQNMPCFIDDSLGKKHIYGLGPHEYDNLFKTWKLHVCYWEEGYGDFHNMPCIVDDTQGKKQFYGLPVHEFPKLFKSLRMNVYYWKEKKVHEFSNFPCVIDDSTELYGLPPHEYDGLMKLCYHHGSTVDPDERDKGMDGPQKDVELVRDYIRHNFPGLEDKPAIVETCMYTVTPDWEVILDTHPVYPNIVIGCGFSGHGFKLAPVVGKILSELARGQPSSFDISAVSIQRFPNVLQVDSNL